MATMSRRREIESELRECERQLRMSMAGGAGLGAAYKSTPFPADVPPGDVLTADEVALYFVASDGSRTQKKVKLTWTDDDLQKGLGTPADPFKKLKEFTAFSNWRYNLDAAFLAQTYEVNKKQFRYTIEGVEVQSLDLFGPRIGFGKFNFKVAFQTEKEIPNPETTATNPLPPIGYQLGATNIPGIFLCRGNSVGILVVILNEDTKKQHTLLTVQPRIAAGRFAFPEIPAGMLDASTNFAGTAAKELKEETGIDLGKTTAKASAKLIDLTSGAYFGTNFSGVYPSAGGCDEMIQLFACELKMSEANMAWLSGRLNGEIHEGEMITLKIVPFGDLVKEAPDMKALSALCLYDRYKQTEEGKKENWYDVNAQIVAKRKSETGSILAPLPSRLQVK